MLKEDNIYLHDLIRTLIDIEMSVMNGKYETAYYLLGRLKIGGLDEFFLEMRHKVREKLYEIHSEKQT
jgi:hypothetical protein